MAEPKKDGTFAALPRRSLDDLSGVRVAIIGVDEASPEEPGKRSQSAGAADAIRKASVGLPAKRQFDFDIGRVLLQPEQEGLIVDLGNLDSDPSRP